MTQKFIVFTILAAILNPHAYGKESMENLAAHQHGHARLQVAMENQEVDLIFLSPAFNLLGFEHEARSADEKTRQEEAISWLETTPLINTIEGHCRLLEAKALPAGAVNNHNHLSEHHEHHHNAGHHHGESSSEHHSEEAASHRDYEVTQQLRCADPVSEEMLTSPLLTRFPELTELDIEWVSASDQGRLTITSPDMDFRLGQ